MRDIAKPVRTELTITLMPETGTDESVDKERPTD
jgi:hypothetical protein